MPQQPTEPCSKKGGRQGVLSSFLEQHQILLSAAVARAFAANGILRPTSRDQQDTLLSSKQSPSSSFLTVIKFICTEQSPKILRRTMSVFRTPIFRHSLSLCERPPCIVFPKCSYYTTYPGGASTTADGIAENPLKKQMHPSHTASQTIMEEKTKYQHFMDVSSKSIVIFGGNGYVGSACAREAVRRGLSVAVINRRGPSSNLKQDPRLAGVRWIQGDALKPDAWKTLIKGVNGVISTIGSFGSNEQMRISCGETNVSAARACKEQSVERFVFVSAHMYKLQLPFLQGYVEGKQKAERVIEELYGSGGIILRPGFIYGSRLTPIPYLNTYANIPLQLLGRPLELLASTSISRSLANVPGLEYLFTSPVSVEDVARCCVAGAIEDIEPSADAQEQHRAVILDSEDISRLGRSIVFE